MRVSAPSALAAGGGVLLVCGWLLAFSDIGFVAITLGVGLLLAATIAARRLALPIRLTLAVVLGLALVRLSWDAAHLDWDGTNSESCYTDEGPRPC